MSSVKDTMKHAGIYSTAAMLGKIASFLMLPFYAHILRENGYAVIGMLDAGMALLVSMLAYGTRGAAVRLYHDQANPERKPAVISTGTTLILVVSILLTLPLFAFARPLASLLLDNPDYDHLLIMSLVAFIFEMAGQGASAWLLIKSQSIKFAAINLFRLLTGMVLNIWLIVILNMGLNGYFISALTISILSNGMLMFFAYRDCGRRYDKAIAREFQDYLLPLVPGNLVSFASRQVERYLVKFQIDLNSVGILEMGYKFPILLAQFVTTPFMQSWNTRRFEIAEQPDAGKRIGEMFTYYLFLAAFMGLVMAVVIKPLLIVLTPPEFHFSYRIARIEIVTLILQGVYLHLTFGLFYAKKTGTLAQIRGWTSAVKVGLAWMCISLWGIAGAAWSAAIIGAVSVVVGFIYSQRHYRVEIPWGKVILICGLAGAMFTVLTIWDPSGTAVFHWLEGKVLPGIEESLARTALGTWKDGKLPVLLAERAVPLSDMIIKGFLGVCFGLILPLVHDGTKIKIRQTLRRR